jgi:hypothetical protein
MKKESHKGAKDTKEIVLEFNPNYALENIAYLFSS